MHQREGVIPARWLAVALLGAVIGGCTERNPAYAPPLPGQDSYRSTDGAVLFDGPTVHPTPDSSTAKPDPDTGGACAGTSARCDGSVLILCSKGTTTRVSCPRGCSAGACVDCTPHRYYRDRDRDGFGATSGSKLACARPAGYVGRGGDCDDSDQDVHPGQTRFFGSARNAGGYDYNCDGREERNQTHVANCQRSGWNCVGDGWQGSVPACGKEARFVHCRRRYYRCEEDTGGRRQRCR